MKKIDASTISTTLKHSGMLVLISVHFDYYKAIFLYSFSKN